jgi:hypothetical protein
VRLRPFGPPRRLALALVLTGAATACSSSSVPGVSSGPIGSPTPPATATPTPSPSGTPAPSLPVASPFRVTQTEQTSTSGTTTFPAVGNGGFTAAVTMPQGNGPVTVHETVTSTNPGPVLAFVRRSTASRALASAPAITPLLYVQFTADAPVTLTGALTFTFALPAIPSQYGYGLAAFDPLFHTWNLAYAQANVGAQLTVTGPNGTLDISPTQSPIFALYAFQGAAPTPAPSSTPQLTVGSSPIPVPTPTATGVGVGSSPIPVPTPTTTGVPVGSSPLPLPT